MANFRHAPGAAALMLLTACVAHFTTYVHLRTSEIEPTSCGRSGPPVIARYERRGVRFEVTMEPALAAGAQAGFLRISAPASVAIALPDMAGHVALDDGSPPIRFRLKLARTTNSPGAVEQRFDFEGLPAGLETGGTLHLPDVVVDAREVVAPVFEFHRQRYAGVAPSSDCRP